MTSRIAVFALALASGCTYKDYKSYNTYYEGVQVEAGVETAASNLGQGGAAGLNRTSPGQPESLDAGSVSAAAGSGSTVPSHIGNTSCTSCLQVTSPANRSPLLELALTPPRDVSNTVVTWRVRISAGTAPVSFVSSFVTQGADAVSWGQVQVDPSMGWQDIGIDFSTVPAFRAPGFLEPTGAAGGGFDPGVAFDKSKLTALQVQATSGVASGVFTPFTVDVDSVTFSDQPSLNVSFDANVGSVALVQSPDATLVEVPR